jgi:hypothetical protein
MIRHAAFVLAVFAGALLLLVVVEATEQFNERAERQARIEQSNERTAHWSEREVHGEHMTNYKDTNR